MARNLSLTTPRFPRGIMFHRFHDREGLPTGQGSLGPDGFEKILHLLGIENIISPEEWIFKLKKNILGANDLCITFDDGLRSQYDVCLPVLEKYGLKAFWFIYSSVFEGKIEKFEAYNYCATRYFNDINDFFELFFDRCGDPVLKQLDKNKYKKKIRETLQRFPFYSINDVKFRLIRDEVLPREKFEGIIDRVLAEKGVVVCGATGNLWLSDSQLKALSENGHYVGLHSYDHPARLSELSYKKQLEQYTKNYEHIKKTCGTKAVAMSHPLNSYNKRTLMILKQLGIACGFRSNMVPPDGGKVNPNCLEMAREDPANLIRQDFQGASSGKKP